MLIALIISFLVIQAEGQEIITQAFGNCGKVNSEAVSYRTTRRNAECGWNIASPKVQGKNSIVLFMYRMTPGDCSTGFASFPAEGGTHNVCDPGVCIAYHIPDVKCNSTLIDGEILNEFSACTSIIKESETAQMIMNFTHSAIRGFQINYKTFNCTTLSGQQALTTTTKIATTSTEAATTTMKATTTTTKAVSATTKAATTTTKTATTTTKAATTTTKAATTTTKVTTPSAKVVKITTKHVTSEESATTSNGAVSVDGEKQPTANQQSTITTAYNSNTGSAASDINGTLDDNQQVTAKPRKNKGQAGQSGDVTTAAMDKKTDKDLWWIILLIVVVSLLVLGLLIYIIVKRQRQQSEKEPDVTVNPESLEMVPGDKAVA